MSRRIRDFFPVNREYTVEYSTLIPRQLSSYHVSVGLPEEIQVRRFLLSSRASANAVQQLVTDLGHLAKRPRALTHVGAGPPEAPVLEAELVDALSRMASLGRLRVSDLERYRSYMSQTLAAFGGTLPALPAPRWTASSAVDQLVRGECDLMCFARLGVQHEQGELVGELTRLGPGPFRTALENLADFIEQQQLDTDIQVDNDPRENGAHAHWQPPDLRFGPRRPEPVRIAFCLSLADEPPSMVESVSRMIIALLGIVAFMALPALANGTFFHWAPLGVLRGSSVITRLADMQQGDAIVAVLLLVPGILLARLDLPSAHSILGELRTFPRRVAYFSVIVTSVLALLAAKDGEDFANAALVGAVILLGQLFMCGVEITSRVFRRRALVPRSVVTPRWLVHAMTRDPRLRARRPDARFSALGARRSDRSGPAAAAADRAADPFADAKPPRGSSWSRWDALMFWLIGRWTTWLVSHDEPPRDPMPPPPSGRPLARPAAAVSRAAQTASSRSTAVRFEIRHLPGQANTFSPEGGHDADDDCAGMREMLGFCALGSAMEVRTRSVSEPGGIVGRVEGRAAQFVDVKRVMDGAGPASASGLFVSDPRSRTPGGDYTELLVSLGDEMEVSPLRARLAMTVMHQLALQLDLTGARPVFINYPVAAPPTMSDGTLMPGPASAPYIRLAVSNATGLAAKRMLFEERAVAAARSFGLGLWVSQGRASSRPAQWRPVVPFDAENHARHLAAVEADTASEAGSGLVVVSFVLPAAADDAGPDMRTLAHRLLADGVGCLALVAWPLQRAIYVNAILPRGPGAPEPAPLAGNGPTSYHGLVAECSVTRAAHVATDGCCDRPGGAAVLEDHLMLATRTELPSRPASSGRRVTPFWVAWDVPDRADVDVITTCILAAARENNRGRGVWLVFLRARHNDRDHLRGRLKLAVEIEDPWSSQEVGLLASRIQQAARERVRTRVPHRTSTMSVQVAWDERWLAPFDS